MVLRSDATRSSGWRSDCAFDVLMGTARRCGGGFSYRFGGENGVAQHKEGAIGSVIDNFTDTHRHGRI
ncbi:MAG: hypothetical protein LBS40_05305 [Burkholderiales bacterium]|nr:hypothetical protein [Burkholderiales bacterium]